MATLLSPTVLLSFNPRNLFSSSSSSTTHRVSLLYHTKTPSFGTPIELHHHHQYPLEPFSRTGRGEALVARAGPPSTTTLVYAFAVPFSLIVATVVASLRLADRLDEKFLEELEKNKAIMDEDDMIDYEDDEDENDDGEEGVKTNKGEDQAVADEAADALVARNRPKKLVQ